MLIILTINAPDANISEAHRIQEALHKAVDAVATAAGTQLMKNSHIEHSDYPSTHLHTKRGK